MALVARKQRDVGIHAGQQPPAAMKSRQPGVISLSLTQPCSMATAELARDVPSDCGMGTMACAT